MQEKREATRLKFVRGGSTRNNMLCFFSLPIPFPVGVDLFLDGWEFRPLAPHASSIATQLSFDATQDHIEMPEPSLANLPTELLEHIIIQLSPEDLLCAACVCRRINAIVEPHLYATVTIRSAASLRAFHQALRNEPARAVLVRSFLIKRQQDVYRHAHDADEPSEESDIRMLPELRKLENLSIESYYLDSDEFNAIFRRAARREILCHLRTCKQIPNATTHKGTR